MRETWGGSFYLIQFEEYGVRIYGSSKLDLPYTLAHRWICRFAPSPIWEKTAWPRTQRAATSSAIICPWQQAALEGPAKVVHSANTLTYMFGHFQLSGIWGDGQTEVSLTHHLIIIIIIIIMMQGCATSLLVLCLMRLILKCKRQF